MAICFITNSEWETDYKFDEKFSHWKNLDEKCEINLHDGI